MDIVVAVSHDLEREETFNTRKSIRRSRSLRRRYGRCFRRGAMRVCRCIEREVFASPFKRKEGKGRLEEEVELAASADWATDPASAL